MYAWPGRCDICRPAPAPNLWTALFTERCAAGERLRLTNPAPMLRMAILRLILRGWCEGGRLWDGVVVAIAARSWGCRPVPWAGALCWAHAVVIIYVTGTDPSLKLGLTD